MGLSGPRRRFFEGLLPSNKFAPGCASSKFLRRLPAWALASCCFPADTSLDFQARCSQAGLRRTYSLFFARWRIDWAVIYMELTHTRHHSIYDNFASPLL